MEFTYVLRFSTIYPTVLPNIFRTLNDVHDARAKEMSEDGMASLNFTKPCHQVVRFVGRTLFIEPVDLQVVVVIVRDALEASLRRFDVLQCGVSCRYFVSNS
jgi:hypothetical protein